MVTAGSTIETGDGVKVVVDVRARAGVGVIVGDGIKVNTGEDDIFRGCNEVGAQPVMAISITASMNIFSPYM